MSEPISARRGAPSRATAIAAGHSTRPVAQRLRAHAEASHVPTALLGLLGLVATFGLWWLGLHLLTAPGSLQRQFTPDAALAALPSLISDGHLIGQAVVSLRRVAIGIGWALLIGVPLGFLVGRMRWLDATLAPTFQFLRMVSPLSWMPIAVMSLGIGERSVCFLLAFAAVWPLLMNTAAGVAQLDARWLELGESLAATRTEIIVHIFIPGIASHVLTGLRLALGGVWIVLVPAEMLGVSAGLGYLILDTRDRLAYSELTAVILTIGAIGFALDSLIRLVYRKFAA